MIIMLMIRIIDNDLHHSNIIHSKKKTKEILQEFYVVTSSPRPSYRQRMQSLLILFAV